MRNLMTRSTTSKDGLKRDLLICETIRTPAVTAKLTKRFIYIVKDAAFVKDEPQIEQFIHNRAGSKANLPQHRSVYRFHNTKEGRDVLLQRTIGDLYVAVENRVYFIKALRYTRVEFVKASQGAPAK